MLNNVKQCASRNGMWQPGFKLNRAFLPARPKSRHSFYEPEWDQSTGGEEQDDNKAADFFGRKKPRWIWKSNWLNEADAGYLLTERKKGKNKKRKKHFSDFDDGCFSCCCCRLVEVTHPQSYTRGRTWMWKHVCVWVWVSESARMSVCECVCDVMDRVLAPVRAGSSA